MLSLLACTSAAEKLISFICFGFLDHISADLEGHPHSVTTIQEPLASTGVGILANVYNSKDWNLIAWQEVQHGKISATLGFCVCLSRSYSENQKNSQTSKFCVRDAVSGDM